MIDIIFHDKTGVTPYNPGQTGGFENAAGSGEIHYYRLFDGVGIMLLRLEMETYTEIRTQIGMIEINFCINGRFETSFSMRDSVLLKPGDMAVSCYDGRHGTRSESRFPLGCYEGLCLEVDPAAAQNWLEKNAPGFSVDFAVLKQNLLGNRWFMFGTAGPRCEHVFRELYENAPYMDLRFLRLKVVELLMLLSRIPQEEGTDLYCSTEQTELAHHENSFLFYQSEDADSGEFTYFAFAPDTMETTYHLEFRYAEDLDDLQSWYEGNYAYWNAAAIAEDYDQATMENVIELFVTENLSEAE